MLWFVLVICFVIILIGTITDLRSLEVPDWLTHGGIVLGLVLNLTLSLWQWSIWPFLASIIGLAIAFVIACLMFYTGQWGGGDAKLLIALGALIGFEHTPFSFGVSFLVNLIFFGGIWGIFWTIGLAIRSKGKTWEKFKKIQKEPSYRKIRFTSTLASVLFLILSFVWKDAQLLLILLAILVYLLGALVIFTKSVELAAMEQWVTPGKLTEGDWLVRPVRAGKVIVSPQKTGLSLEQVALLKKLAYQKKIDKVLVKYGVPFVPAFLLAFVVTYFIGNVFFAALKFLAA